MPIVSNFPTGSGSSGSGIALAAVSDIKVLEASGKVYVKWTDPEDVIVSGVELAMWAGTLLVRKAGSMPVSRRDGTIVLDSKERNAYANTYFCDSGLSNNVTYYYKFFPYTEGERYTEDVLNEFAATPEPIGIGDVTNIAVTASLNGRVQITWDDPETAVVSDGVTLTTWTGTKVVYKTGGYPTSVNDGTLAINSTVADAYKTNPLTVSGLTNDTVYYFGFFPISADGVVNTNTASGITATPDYLVAGNKPNQKGTLTYTGSAQSPSWNNYDSSKMTIGGTTSATDAGTYTVTFTLGYDYCWADGTTDPVTVTWTINKAVVSTVPSQNGSLTYDGNTKTPTWSNYSSTNMTLGGTTSATDAGTYTATFTPKTNYCWSDGSTSAKNVTWTIGRATISAVPSQSGTLTYSGSAQSPSWSNYDSAKMTLGGATSGTNAGTYTATFTPTSNYMWSDSSTAAKNIDWSINKAAGSLSLSKTSITLNSDTTSTTFTVTRVGDGAITVTSSNTSVVTATLSGTTVTVSSVNGTSGEATVTVKVAEGTNHTAPSNKTCAVKCEFIPSLNEATWEQVREVSDAGIAANCWAIGDRKAVTLNGTVGSATFSNETYYCYIIGIDHNSSKEGTNRIHFQFGYNALDGGKSICFVDAGYSKSQTSGVYFNMNNESSNAGGWENSSMRTVICPAFKNVMPSDLQSVLKTVTKYSDNTGGKKDDASYVTATTDTIFLLAEWEVFGLRNRANTAEKDYQSQYAWYSSGNSAKKTYHAEGIVSTSSVVWWLRSVSVAHTHVFCSVDGSGTKYYSAAQNSYGFSPAFCV